MSTIVQVISDGEMAIKACGRACADMRPSTLPLVPVSPLPSLAGLLREHPEAAIQPEWLALMETSPTLH